MVLETKHQLTTAVYSQNTVVPTVSTTEAISLPGRIPINMRSFVERGVQAIPIALLPQSSMQSSVVLEWMSNRNNFEEISKSLRANGPLRYQVMQTIRDLNLETTRAIQDESIPQQPVLRRGRSRKGTKPAQRLPQLTQGETSFPEPPELTREITYKNFGTFGTVEILEDDIDTS